MTNKLLTTYTASNHYTPGDNAKEVARFINEEGIAREDIFTIVAGPNYQTVYYFVEAIDVKIKELHYEG